MEEARVARAVTAVRGRAAGEIPKYHTGCATPADRTTTAVAVGGRLFTTSSPVTPVLSVLLECPRAGSQVPTELCAVVALPMSRCTILAQLPPLWGVSRSRCCHSDRRILLEQIRSAQRPRAGRSQCDIYIHTYIYIYIYDMISEYTGRRE